MTTESILLIGRGTRATRAVLETHADRLAARTRVDSVEVAVYEHEPLRELRGTVEGLSADTVYAVPMCTAHTYDTVDEIPALLSYAAGTVRYCEPVGQSPAVTNVLAERGAELVSPGEDASLVLVGFGSSSKPHNRQTVDHHAARLRERSAYGSVLTCYLLQNPAVECVRYNLTTPRAVAVPVFVAPSEITDDRIPAALELARGGLEYADPLGEHPRVTDAVHGEIEKRRALARDDSASTEAVDARPTRTPRPVSTDGEGLSE
ncbi:CbiX/SirB N-terminal domain-containing protein [Haloarcula nitratireducens]|uniref:Sirohydrochlorin chelatase n=1 Tax=Haloarcula nitratireducens TaxID=2487749 RepID=A0AAW4PFG1_9EURY|nr:CbiX/SirB N-terminal domain-containing protein [Halomicroarcula nitratireducens]MBX0296230.1 sirohydrochlorin chelatase [Halomicroarcula nitratireducens]